MIPLQQARYIGIFSRFFLHFLKGHSPTLTGTFLRIQLINPVSHLFISGIEYILIRCRISDPILVLLFLVRRPAFFQVNIVILQAAFILFPRNTAE